MALALVGCFRRHADTPFASWAFRRGLQVLGLATALNLAVGLWLLLAQPSATILRLVGGHPVAATAFWTAVLLGFVLAAAAPLALGGARPAQAIPLLPRGSRRSGGRSGCSSSSS